MIKIVYVGFGIVSQGLAEIILRNNSIVPLAENRRNTNSRNIGYNER